LYSITLKNSFLPLNNKTMSITTPITVASTSKQGSVNLKDVLNSLMAAVIAPVLPIVTESLHAGSLTFNWKSIGIAAALGFVGWLVKNFLQPSQTVITGASEGATTMLTIPPAGTKTTTTQTKM
jgi:hypothetical protein